MQLGGSHGPTRLPAGDTAGPGDGRRRYPKEPTDGPVDEEVRERLAAKSVAMEKLEAVRAHRAAYHYSALVRCSSDE
jgi:hypothetical protein